MAIAETILLYCSRFIWKKVERDLDENNQKKKKKVQTDVSRGMIGRTAYANATSGSTEMH